MRDMQWVIMTPSPNSLSERGSLGWVSWLFGGDSVMEPAMGEALRRRGMAGTARLFRPFHISTLVDPLFFPRGVSS